MNRNPENDPPGSGTYVGGSINGNGNATGHGARASYTSTSAPADPSHEALLQAIRCLRDDLRRYSDTRETQVLAASLEEAEQQVTDSGRAEPNLLNRLRAALEGANGALGALTSATTLGTVVAGLLGR